MVENLPVMQETCARSLGREDPLGKGAQMVKNMPAMQETWARSLGREDPLEKGAVPTPVFWPGEFHGQRGLAGCSP